MQVVWLKRDLRGEDNRALTRACEHGPTLPLYVAEPAFWRLPGASGRQRAFVTESPDRPLQESWKARNSWAVRGDAAFRNEAAAIQVKHGSRKHRARTRRKGGTRSDPAQLDLPFESGSGSGER